MRLIIISFIVLIFQSTLTQAKTEIIFINGINNTQKEAYLSLEEISRTFIESQNYTGSNKINFSYKLIYNPIGFYGEEGLVKDARELFMLKIAEEWYSSAFEAILSPYNNINYSIDKEAAKIVDLYRKDMTPKFNSLEEHNLVDDFSMFGTKLAINELILNIKRNIRNKDKTIVIAHSEGNLLANLAYANLATLLGSDLNNHLRIVNVANTAKFSPNNLNFTHSKDKALKELHNIPINSFGGVLVQRNTPLCEGQCAFELAEPSFNGDDINFDWFSDIILRHSFTDIYLSRGIYTAESIIDQGVKFTKNKNSFSDRFQDYVYAAANSFDRFTKISNGACVKDNKTGLMWDNKYSKNKIDYYLWGSFNSESCYSEIDGCNTDSYVRLFNKKSWCGYDDWRLPSRDELLSITKVKGFSDFCDKGILGVNYFTSIYSSSFYPVPVYEYATSTLSSSGEKYFTIDFECATPIADMMRLRYKDINESPIGIMLVRD